MAVPTKISVVINDDEQNPIVDKKQMEEIAQKIIDLGAEWVRVDNMVTGVGIDKFNQ